MEIKAKKVTKIVLISCLVLAIIYYGLGWIFPKVFFYYIPQSLVTLADEIYFAYAWKDPKKCLKDGDHYLSYKEEDVIVNDRYDFSNFLWTFNAMIFSRSSKSVFENNKHIDNRVIEVKTTARTDNNLFAYIECRMDFLIDSPYVEYNFRHIYSVFETGWNPHEYDEPLYTYFPTPAHGKFNYDKTIYFKLDSKSHEALLNIAKKYYGYVA